MPIVVTGTAPGLALGELVVATGSWRRVDGFGWQLKAEAVQVSQPTSSAGIVRYLGSGVVEGIGAGLAAKIVERFGADTLKVIADQGDRLREVKGISEARKDRIVEAFAQKAAHRASEIFLLGHGLGPARAARVCKAYGAKTVETVQEDPYKLARDVEGIGFAIADNVAQALGFSMDCPARIRGAVRHILSEAVSSEGHCALPEELLIERAKALLRGPTEQVVKEAARGLVRDGEMVMAVVMGAKLYYKPAIKKAEDLVADRIASLAKGTFPFPCADLEAKLVDVQVQTCKNLSPEQLQAVHLAFRHRLLVVTGGPGCGKTSLLDTLLRLYRAEGVRVLCCAPTGRAARRIFESTGHQASTIHRLLGFGQGGQAGFAVDEDAPLDCDVVVVDEVSMCDIPLARHLLCALPPNASLVMIGDADQLPSVGPGLFLRNLIEAGTVPVVRLTHVFRQAAGSRITLNAHRVNRGFWLEPLPVGQETDFYFIECRSPEEIRSRVLNLVRDRIPKKFGLDPRRDIQVLSPMHKNLLGTVELNLALREALNGGVREVAVRGKFLSLRVGDRVIQTRNNYNRGNGGVFNGDLGEVAMIDEKKRVIMVRFDDASVLYTFAETDELALAYCLTIHRSQGSEYPACVIPLANQHFMMLERNLLYTAITRGRKLAVLVGERSAVERAIQNNPAIQRFSGLLPRLQSL